jgi:hypothetical protein
VVGQPRRHGRGDAERLVDAAEVLVGEVDRNRVLVVLNLLRERIGEAGKAAVPSNSLEKNLPKTVQ